MRKGLTPKQQLFIKEYLVDKNATRAAMSAGYSKKTAAKIGSENLHKPEIVSAIKIELDLVMKKVEAQSVIVHKTKSEWLHRVESIAFSDSTEMFSEDNTGKLRISMKDLKERKLGHLVKKFKIHKNGTLEVELKNDQHSLELIAKHNGWISEQFTFKAPIAELSEEDFDKIFKDDETAAAALMLAEATCKPTQKKESN